MNLSILNPEIQEYIDSHLNSDLTKIILKGSPFKNVTIQDLIEQIEAKKKCQKKLPTWFSAPNIYYPNKLNIEQTSSEETAKYKASLLSGESVIDITGGFGIDSYYFSKQFKKGIHCDLNSKLSEIVNHNYKQLHITNVTCFTGDGLAYLKSTSKKFDWIFIDPSRRHDSKGKVFFLKDCLPNVPDHLEMLFDYSNNIMIKTSPLLDISIGLKELKSVKKVHVVSVNNEVKELLWILENNFTDTVNIETINIKSDGIESFSFDLLTESQVEVDYNEPLDYLYEPNSSILKSGAFKSIAKRYNVFKLHKHTHLYTSKNLIENFPGRTFKIIQVLPYNKKIIKSLKLTKANISTRNFPESVDQIKKKFKIMDGGDVYLFFTTNWLDKRYVISCAKK